MPDPKEKTMEPTSTLTAVPDAPDEEAPEAPETPQEAPQSDPEPPPAAEVPEGPAKATRGSRAALKKAAAKPAAGGPPIYKPLEALPFDPLGLDIDRNMDWDEWTRLVRGLMTLEEGYQWWMGDALAFGEEKFAEQAYQVFGDSPLRIDPKTLANQASVSRAVPRDVRRVELSWSHHREVAAVKDKRTMKRLLERAVKEELSCADLRLLVTKALPAEPANTPPQKRRQIPFSINVSVMADQEHIGQTVVEQARDFILRAFEDRGVTPASFSVKGLPKVEPVEVKATDPEEV